MLQVMAEMDPGGALELELPTGETVVYLPADALAEKGSLSLLPWEAELFPEAGEQGWSRPRVMSLEFCAEEGRLVDVCCLISQKEWSGYLEDAGRFGWSTTMTRGQGGPPGGRRTSPVPFAVCIGR